MNFTLEQFLQYILTPVGAGVVTFGAIAFADKLAKERLSGDVKFYGAMVLAFLIPLAALAAEQAFGLLAWTWGGLFEAFSVGYLVSVTIHRQTTKAPDAPTARALAPVIVPGTVVHATPPPSDPPVGVLTPADLKAVKNQVISAMTHSGDVRAYWLSVIGQAGVLTEATVHGSPGLYTRISETTHEELVKYFGAQDMNPPTPVAVDPQSA